MDQKSVPNLLGRPNIHLVNCQSGASGNMSHNQNLVHKWSTQNHASRTKPDSRSDVRQGDSPYPPITRELSKWLTWGFVFVSTDQGTPTQGHGNGEPSSKISELNREGLLMWVWVRNGVTPKWVALVSGRVDQNPRSISWWLDFDPYPHDFHPKVLKTGHPFSWLL